MNYPHGLVIRGPSAAPGMHDPVTHVFTPGAPAVPVYDDRADVQDGGERIERAQTDRPETASDAVAFLRNEALIGAIRPEMTATVTWENGSTAEATVMAVIRLDAKVKLRWLRPS